MTRTTRWARRILFALIGVAILYAMARRWLGAVAESRLEAGIARIRAAGEPVTLAEALPPVPVAENAAPMVQAAWAQVPEEPDPSLLGPFQNDPASAPAAAVDAATDWVERSRSALDLLSRAIDDRPRCRFGPGEAVADLRFEEIPGLMKLSRLLKARADLASLRGDLASALADARRIDRFGDRIADSPLLIHRLVGMGVQQVAIRAIEVALARGRPAEDSLRALERHLATLPPRRLDRSVILAERAYSSLQFDRMRESGTSPRDALWDSSDGCAFLCALYPEPALTLDQVRGLDLWTRALPLAGRPWSEVGAAWGELESAARRETPWYARYSGGLAPTGALVSLKSSQTEARRDLARLALRLEIHEASNGTLPARLEDLGPEPVPADPVSGLPVAYRVTGGGKGYLLYAFGKNRRDDGGAEEPAPDAPGADDIAFRRPAR